MRGLARSQDGFIELIAKPGRQKLTGETGPGTEIWGYNGSVPGPMIRAREGDRVRVRLINQLDQPTSIHWHGIRIANAMDGVVGLTQKAVEPGGSFEYDFIAPDAGTYWYHTHNRAWEQMARGLYGALIIDGATSTSGRAATEFDHDIPFIVDDWRLDSAGQIDEASFGNMRDSSHAGRLGNWLTVNARNDPQFNVRMGDIARLRVMNTANARVLNIKFPDLSAQVIAIDGHTVKPRPLEDVMRIAPGQRVDLCFRADGAGETILQIQEISHSDPLTFASIKIAGPAIPSDSGATALPTLAPTRNKQPDLANAQRHTLIMEGGAMGRLTGGILNGQQQTMRSLVESGRAWAFNGIAGDLTKPFFSVALGRTIVVEMVNDTRWPHAMHLHGHHFRVVEKNGTPTTGDWRDTVLVEPGDRVAMAFVADNPGKWFFHCHMMEHQAAGMRTWIEVTA